MRTPPENEKETRQKIVREALSWVGTPYHNCGTVKGPRGGTDCAMFLVCVYGDLGLIPPGFDPRPYAPQWHVHKDEEKYLNFVRELAIEIPGPPERMPLPGDVILCKIGRLFAHGAIVTNWPMIVHAVGGDAVLPQDISKSTTGKHAIGNVARRYFSLWG